GALIDERDLAPAHWDYVALGHYHVAQPVAANAWYAGSIEYVAPNPWGQMQDEAERGRVGKGYLLVDLPGARVTFRPIAPLRRHVDLPLIEGKGLTPKELDAHIATAVAAAKPPIDDQVVRLLVFDVSRATARDRDHGHRRAQRFRQDDAPGSARLGDLRRAGGAGRQGLDPPARREGSGPGRGRARVPARRPRVSRDARPLDRGAASGRAARRQLAQ